MAAGLVDLHLRRVVGPEEPEGDEEDVEETGMVRILDVVEHQLPVRRDELSGVAEHLELPTVEHAVEELEHLQADELLERLDIIRERGEYHTMACGRMQLAQAVVLEVKVRGHPPLLLDAAPKVHADEVALQVVRPLVVWAHELGSMAEGLLAELHAAMRATVLDEVDIAGFVTHYNGRLVADGAALQVSRHWDLRFERDIGP